MVAEVIPIEQLRKRVRSQRERYEANCKRGDYIFQGRRSQLEIRSGIAEYFHETDDEGHLHTNGYIVAPPRVGKTIIIGDYIIGINTTKRGEYVLRDKARNKHTLICVPTNQLVDQWADKLLGELQSDDTRKPSLFGDKIRPEDVGIYHARPGMTDEEKLAILSKPIVIVTDDSVRAFVQHMDGENPAPLIHGKDYDTVVLDEVDHRLRGDVHSQIFKDTFFGTSKIIGMTATPLFKSGQTIGDYLFDGKAPICEIMHKEAIDRREITPNTTITYEPTVDRVDSDLRIEANHWDSLSDAQKDKFIRQTGSDDAAIDIIRKGRHPITGQRLRDLKQLWKGETVSHSELFAQKLNEAFARPGETYAAVVYGDMDPNEYKSIMERYKSGEIKALVQCKLLGRGFDDDDIGLTGQLGPSQSPNDIIQFFTRADTLNKEKDRYKVAVHLIPRFEGINQLHIGELLGGQIMLPPGYEYPPTAGKQASGSDPDLWPKIEGATVYYTVEQTQQLAERLARERRVGELPPKKPHMLTLSEMAVRLNAKEADLLHRVYEPLEDAYAKRKARDKVITADPAEYDRDNIIFINTWRFPVRDVGYCREGGQEKFFIDESQVSICQRALYGDLAPIRKRPEMLTLKMAQGRLQTDDATMEALRDQLRDAFFKVRSRNAEYADIDGMKFAYKDFKFYLNKDGQPELFIAPDALPSAYRFCHRDATETRAELWARGDEIKKLKTAQWLTESQVLEELNTYGTETRDVQQIFEKIRQTCDRPGRNKFETGDEGQIDTGMRGKRLKVAKKYLPCGKEGKKHQYCIHGDELEWLKDMLGMESNQQGRRRA